MANKLPNLVKIIGTEFTFYSGKDIAVTVNSPDMDKEQLEYYRTNHKDLQDDANGVSVELEEAFIAVAESDYAKLLADQELMQYILLQDPNKVQEYMDDMGKVE